jgi:hypothetical protein
MSLRTTSDSSCTPEMSRSFPHRELPRISMFSSTCHRAYLNSCVSHTLQLLQVRQWDVECIACRGLGLQHQLENWLLLSSMLAVLILIRFLWRQLKFVQNASFLLNHMEEPTRAADKQSTIREASTISPIFTTAVCRTKARTPFLSERSICTRGPIHDYLIVGLHHKLLLKLKTLPGYLSSTYYN